MGCSHTTTGSRLAWSCSGEVAVVENHSVGFYDDTLELIRRVSLEYACYVAFSPDGSMVALGSWSNGLVVPLSQLR